MAGDPPRDVAAEEAVLAALLLDDGAMAVVKSTGLMASEFFGPNGVWFAAAERLWERGEPITYVSWCAEVGSQIDTVGGEPYLVEVAGKYFTAVGAEVHANIVRRCSYARKMLTELNEVASKAWAVKPNQKEIDALWQESVDRLLSLRPPGSDGMVPIWEAKLEESYGAPWGIPVLDRLTNGIAPGKLTVLAGGTGQGKSMLAAQIATNYAMQHGRSLIFTKEMKEGEYRQRIERRTVAEHGDADVAGLDIHLKTPRHMNASYIRAEAQYRDGERMHDDAPIPLLIVVDYLQLMEYSGSEKESEASRIGKTTTALKEMTQDIDCHVILLTQYSREASRDQRVGWGVKDECLLNPSEKFNAPFNESFKGSSSIEQDADHTIQIVRHTREYPHICHGHVDIYLTKNRSGRVGRCFAFDDFQNARFRFFTEQEAYAYAGARLDLGHRICIDQGLHHA